MFENDMYHNLYSNNRVFAIFSYDFWREKSSAINIFPSLDIGIERISLSFGYMVIYHNQYIKRTIFNWVSSWW